MNDLENAQCLNEGEWEVGIGTTGWQVSKYGVFSGPYFPVFGSQKNLYLDTFHAKSIESYFL